MELQIKKLGLEYLDRVYSHEKESYPSDEAASKEKMETRMKDCGEYFCGYVDGKNDVVGFICGTKIKNENYSEESLDTHEPDGKNLCIHSVCVAKKHRRKGVATRLLKEYISEMKSDKTVEIISLICKKNLIGLYKSVGFNLLGESKVEHGRDLWYDMNLIFS